MRSCRWALVLGPCRPARPDPDPLAELRGSVLRFDDPFAP